MVALRCFTYTVQKFIQQQWVAQRWLRVFCGQWLEVLLMLHEVRSVCLSLDATPENSAKKQKIVLKHAIILCAFII